MKEGRLIRRTEASFLLEDGFIARGWFGVDLPVEADQQGIPRSVGRAIGDRLGVRAIEGGNWEFDTRIWFRRRVDAVWYVLHQNELWGGIDWSYPVSLWQK